MMKWPLMTRGRRTKERLRRQQEELERKELEEIREQQRLKKEQLKEAKKRQEEETKRKDREQEMLEEVQRRRQRLREAEERRHQDERLKMMSRRQLKQLKEEEELEKERRRVAKEAMDAETVQHALHASTESYEIELEKARQQQRELDEAAQKEEYAAGRCVVCWDEQATMAVVDCGHLALCKTCSDGIMESTRKCPLCRAGIGSPEQLLRIYRT